MQGLLLFLAMASFSLHAGTADAALTKDYIAAQATLDGVDVQTALTIVKDESNFNCTVIGDHGTSYGCWQIHLPAHLDITPQQALDPVFSTEWSINQLKDGNCKIWSTCPTSASP